MILFQADLPGGAAVYTAAVDCRDQRHAVARALCRAVTGQLPLFTSQGRPYLPHGPYISLSHSGSLAACAVASSPVGVDVERERAVSPRLLARAARAGYEGGPFLLWWTAREANCKRLGQGFTWSPLPAPAALWQGTLEHNGETYYYSVCT